MTGELCRRRWCVVGRLGMKLGLLEVVGVEEWGWSLGKGLEVRRGWLERVLEVGGGRLKRVLGRGMGEVGGGGVGELSDRGKGILWLVGGLFSSPPMPDVDVVDSLGEMCERVRVQSRIYIHAIY